MEEKKQYTRLDAVGGSSGKATVETIVDALRGSEVFENALKDISSNPPQVFTQKSNKIKVKVTSRFGRITIEDPALSRLQNNTLILQITDGQCCVRPSQEELDYVRKLAAILRKGLTE